MEIAPDNTDAMPLPSPDLGNTPAPVPAAPVTLTGDSAQTLIDNGCEVGHTYTISAIHQSKDGPSVDLELAEGSPAEEAGESPEQEAAEDASGAPEPGEPDEPDDEEKMLGYKRVKGPAKETPSLSAKDLES